jgi:hypothetical protein
VLAACGGSSQASIDASSDSLQHGTISVFSGGAEIPPTTPGATLLLPDMVICQTDVTIDACRVRTICNPTTESSVSAGNVMFGTTPPVTIMSMPPPPGPGAAEFHDVGDFSAGQTVMFSIDGSGAIPALSASVVAPAQVTVTSRWDSPISWATDYELTWIAGTTGTVNLGVSAGIDGDFTLLDCSFPAAAGQGTIPAMTLQTLHGYGLGRIDVSDVATRQAANWTMDFVVGYDALWTDGSFAGGVFGVEP